MLLGMKHEAVRLGAEGAAGGELNVGSGFVSGAGLGRLMQRVHVTSEQAAETQQLVRVETRGWVELGVVVSCGTYIR
jgi:hypothetical protein